MYTRQTDVRRASSLYPRGGSVINLEAEINKVLIAVRKKNISTKITLQWHRCRVKLFVEMNEKYVTEN